MGHSLGLRYPVDAGGNEPDDLGTLMDSDIADQALFGRTRGITADDALAAAINYTWSFDPTKVKDFGDAPDS